MPNDVEVIIEINEDRNFLSKFVQNPMQYFHIGSDGGESYYYIDLQNPDCPVYSFDLESGRFAKEASNFQLWIVQIQ